VTRTKVSLPKRELKREKVAKKRRGTREKYVQRLRKKLSHLSKVKKEDAKHRQPSLTLLVNDGRNQVCGEKCKARRPSITQNHVGPSCRKKGSSNTLLVLGCAFKKKESKLKRTRRWRWGALEGTRTIAGFYARSSLYSMMETVGHCRGNRKKGEKVGGGG